MLKKEHPVPLYTQLTETLIRYIKEEGAINEKMLSEREICNQYHVSRTTVRTALAELEEAGYVYKRHGKGTYISGLWKEKQNLLDTYSFTDHMRSLGKRPETIIESFETKRCNPYIAEAMGLTERDLVYKIVRLRLAENEPMMYETTFVPVSMFPGLDARLIEQRGLYNIFSKIYGEKISYADEEFSSSLVREGEAERLRIAENAACLRLKRLTVNKDNKIIEFSLSVARSDQFVYKVRHFKY